MWSAPCILAGLLQAVPSAPVGEAGRALAEEGVRLAKDLRYGEALTKFEAALAVTAETDPDRALMLWNRARTLKALNRPEAAVGAFEVVIRSTPDAELRARAEDEISALRRDALGALQVDCAYENATVSVEGVPVDPQRCPARWADVRAGHHRLTLRTASAFAVSLEATVKAGDQKKVDMPPPALLHLAVTPRSAEVKIDGQKVQFLAGTAVQLPPGSHTIQATSPGMLPYSAAVTLPPAGANTVDVSLLALDRTAPTGAERGAGPMVTTISGGALVGSGVALFLLNRWNDEAADRENVDLTRDLGVSAYTLGAALAAGGLAWWAWPPADDPTTVACGAGGVGLLSGGGVLIANALRSGAGYSDGTTTLMAALGAAAAATGAAGLVIGIYRHGRPTSSSRENTPTASAVVGPEWAGVELSF